MSAKRFASPQNGQGDITAVQDVSLSIADGEVVSLIGPSGCGKSTLLNMGSGLYSPSGGEVFVDGTQVTAPNAHVAFMLQKRFAITLAHHSPKRRIGLTNTRSVQ